jgi:hypothetical protein
MKRNLLGALAIATVVVFSAFTAKKTTSLYYSYQSGAQTQISNFTRSMTSPGTIAGADVLAWIKVEAQDQDNATQEEFTAKFDQLNVTNSSASSLNDEVENHIDLELKAD